MLMGLPFLIVLSPGNGQSFSGLGRCPFLEFTATNTHPTHLFTCHPIFLRLYSYSCFLDCALWYKTNSPQSKSCQNSCGLRFRKYALSLAVLKSILLSSFPVFLLPSFFFRLLCHTHPEDLEQVHWLYLPCVQILNRTSQ